MTSKRIRQTLFLSLMATLIVVMTACGGKTLESYFDDHQDEFKEIEKAMNTSGNGVAECTLTAKENTANYVLKFTKTYSEGEVQQLKSALEKQQESSKANYVSMLKQMEKKTELENLAFHIEYQNGDGSIIYETDVTDN